MRRRTAIIGIGVCLVIGLLLILLSLHMMGDTAISNTDRLAIMNSIVKAFHNDSELEYDLNRDGHIDVRDLAIAAKG